jgi:hypothetical protein
VVPLSRDGPDTYDNTVAACLHCNGAKGSMAEQAFRRSPALLQRQHVVSRVPDRLSNETGSPFHDAMHLDRGIRILLNGSERTQVVEYCISEGWIRLRTPSRDRRGRPLVLTLTGIVEALYHQS